MHLHKNFSVRIQMVRLLTVCNNKRHETGFEAASDNAMVTKKQRSATSSTHYVVMCKAQNSNSLDQICVSSPSASSMNSIETVGGDSLTSSSSSYSM